ncbi:universal stress protein [Natrarchaeobaculum sulfurireducens]|uniref:Nucleotide-binding protein, UspA family n=1 Tax=Natrarchaeobaculum sulfurireducens TaxID=2044521 RepID=A0A346PE22_9EURY|nr:universal stress protein [Natrarchaeobaculum sulfurireducens]AXR77767.1 Nucleotide-binding protein, UspA family [Natrarchaeobaculum sulfurireducens]AXR82250.1 hypothetical protein AArcMg_2253 [Natrarchaeobaculum sulfurireducens]
MTFVVPFDGTELAEAALIRAVEFSTVLDEPITAVVVVPNLSDRYARERGWIGDDESFDLRTILSQLQRTVADIAPEANFQHIVVDRRAPAGSIATRLRNFARQADASMVFIGSENAGQIVASVSSVGAKVAAENTYDVVIVRNRGPAKATKLSERSPYQGPDGDSRNR